MSPARAILPVCLAFLASCATQNPIYQSKAPEIRGGRAVASSIDLVSEVNIAGPGLQRAIVGVFYSRETFQDGGAEAVLFALRGVNPFVGRRAGTINDYDLRAASSLTMDQARQLLDALGNYLATDPKTLPPTRMLSFELDSGTVGAGEGSATYRPLREVTFVVAFSVTNAGKSFKTVFPPAVAGSSKAVNQTFDLSEDQVRKLRDAIAAAVAKATPGGGP